MKRRQVGSLLPGGWTGGEKTTWRATVIVETRQCSTMLFATLGSSCMLAYMGDPYMDAPGN